MESIDKLRDYSHLDDDKWTLETGEIIHMYGSKPNDPNAINWGEQWRKIADEIEQEIVERYIELPVDADGVPIRLGDVVAAQDEQPFEVRAFQYDALGWFAIERLGSQWNVNQLHHVNPRTIEDVLGEAVGELFNADISTGSTEWDEVIAKYAEEIRGMMA